MATPIILIDVFPANVIVAPENFLDDFTELKITSGIPNTLYRDVTRIIVTDTRIIVAQDTPTGAQIVGNEEYEKFVKGSRPDYYSYVVTKSGKQIGFYKDHGCGCASRLKSWNPYKTILSTNG